VRQTSLPRSTQLIESDGSAPQSRNRRLGPIGFFRQPRDSCPQKLNMLEC